MCVCVCVCVCVFVMCVCDVRSSESESEKGEEKKRRRREEEKKRRRAAGAETRARAIARKRRTYGQSVLGVVADREPALALGLFGRKESAVIPRHESILSFKCHDDGGICGCCVNETGERERTEHDKQAQWMETRRHQTAAFPPLSSPPSSPLPPTPPDTTYKGQNRTVQEARP